ncbi:aminotransferase DegT, partial [Candidatus Endoriftia persephone str. Guaymas]|nr:aminotransferase DegT [Candidatus Endoriftia persephone str. Guaymas]
DRDQLQKQLAELEIPTAIHYPVPLNAQPVFADCGQPEETPESLKLSQRVISLPMHPYLSEEDQETIVTALQAVLT